MKAQTALAIVMAFLAFLLVGYVHGAGLCTGVSCQSDQACRWGNCVAVRNNAASDFTELVFDTGSQCEGDAVWDSAKRKWLCADPRECTAGPSALPLPNNYKSGCLYSINITEFRVDDYGSACAGGTCGPGSGSQPPDNCPASSTGGNGGAGGTCGNNKCDAGESRSSCPSDCLPCGVSRCGDGVCLGRCGETPITCLQDCPLAAVAKPTFPIIGLVSHQNTVLHSAGFGAYAINKDVTDKFDRTNPQVVLYVKDLQAAQGGVSRGVSAKFKTLVRNPSPTEKCVAGPGGKPVLAPLCAGTKAECTVTPDEVVPDKTNPSSTTKYSSTRCINLATLDGTYVAGQPRGCCVAATGAASGNYRAQCRDQHIRTYTCDNTVNDETFSKYGTYNTFGPSVAPTQQLVIEPRTLCSAGCTGAGVCRTVIQPGGTSVPGNKPPTLTSITATPHRIGVTGTINMTSVASDPDTILSGSASRKEKIKLECDTEEGTIHSGSGGATTTQTGACKSGEIELKNVNAADPVDRAATNGYWCDDDAFTLSARSTVRLICTGGSSATAFIRTGSGNCQSWTFSGGMPSGQTLLHELPCGSSGTAEETVTLDAGNYIAGVYATRHSRQGIACLVGGAGSGGGGATTIQTGTFSVGLCSGGLAESNPNCTITKIPDSWKAGGQKHIFCRVKDESGLYSAAGKTDVIIDNVPPTSTITAPPANSVQTGSFQVTVVDSDDGQLDKCFYTTTAAVPQRLLSGKLRPCNAQFIATVGPNGDCTQQGTCSVSVFATDKQRNTGEPDNRSFNIKLIFTNITSPPEGYQRSDFAVRVEDRDFTASSSTTGTTGSTGSGLTTNPASLSVASGGTATATISGGTAPYSSLQQPNSATATASISGSSLTVEGIAAGTTTVTLRDSSSPQKTATVQVMVTSSSGGGGGTGTTTSTSDLVCTYDVFSISSTQEKPVDNAARDCNADFTVAVGPDGDCNVMGEKTCKVVSRLKKGSVEDTSTRFYSIDWVTPTSEITQIPAGWVRGDFNIAVVDDPQGSAIIQCQYKAASRSDALSSSGTGFVETLRWTNRPCSAASPASVRITVGSGKNCRHEGGEACNITVRPLGRGRDPGRGDSKTVAILLSDANPDGFSNVNYERTERGLRFTGTARRELRTKVFYVCNLSSNYTNCVAASGNSGQDSPNFCSSLTDSCELRCSDRTVSFYFAAQGVPTGESNTVTLLSAPVKNVACPTFRIGEINRLLAIFGQLDERISVQILMTDTFIRDKGETAEFNNDTIALLEDALLLTRNHTAYMDNAMQDLTVTVANDIIARSDSVLNEISRLLNGITPPLRVRLEVQTPPTIVFDRTSSLPVTLTKNRDRQAFARIYCSLTKPDGTILRANSSCLQPNADFNMEFLADKLGRWSYSCLAGRSLTAGCTGAEINQSAVAGTFDALPGFNTFIESVSAPITLLRNQIAAVTAVVNNPDEIEKFVNVSCEFRIAADVRRNSSACTAVPARGTAAATVRMIAERLGTWNVSNCRVFASQFPACQGAVLDNVSRESKVYTVVLPDNVFIESVVIPQTALNGTRTAITATVQNPTSSASYVNVTCALQPPFGTVTISDRKGMETNSQLSFLLNITPHVTGTWSVTDCKAFKSSSLDFSGPTLAHNISNVGTFNVTQGSNLTITSVTLAGGVRNGTTTTISLHVNNPLATRFGRASCTFRSPLNVQITNSSSCVLMNGTSTTTVPINIFADAAGLWRIDSCSVFASVNPDCSSVVLHDSEADAGTFTVTTTAALPALPLPTLFVQNITVASAAQDNSQLNVIVHARNPNSANSSYSHAGCSFVDPNQNILTRTSSCLLITPNTTQQYIVSQQANMPGNWIVRDCFVNASSHSSCTPSVTHNVSSETRTVLVTLPTDLYVTGADMPDVLVNNSNVNIDIFVSNPLNDDRYGFVSCIIEDPVGGTQTRSTPCASVPQLTSRTYNVSLFANIVGTWTVRNCSVPASSSSTCQGAVATGELINGDIFSVIRGYNLTISSLALSGAVYLNRPADASYTLRNPSTSDRFGRVTCLFTRDGQSVTNRSACFTLARESFIDSRAAFVPNTLGNWTVTCSAERAFDSSCASLETHDTVSDTFNVVQPPDLFIQSIDIPAVATKDAAVAATLKIRNTALTPAYGFTGCSFRNRLNETTRNVTECQNLTADTSFANVLITPELRGNWTVMDCFVNASMFAENCGQNRTHNRPSTIKSFTVSAPLLTIQGSITLASENLVVGDLAEIVVNVKNIGEGELTAFVNCTLINPNNFVYRLTTPEQAIPLNDVREFRAQRVVDITGRWRIGTCSVYSIRSPPTLETQRTVNRDFEVGYPAAGECSSSTPCVSGVCDNGQCIQQQCNVNNCPGTNSACYCSDDQCVACGSGYACSQAQCVQEVVIDVCRSSSECASGYACVNGVCQQKPPECFADTDCPSSYECRSGTCYVASRPVDTNLVMFLAVILAVIMVPVILFIYIKRSL